MAGTWCPDCRAFMADGTTCPDCRRRRAWGTVLGILATCQVVVLNDQLKDQALEAVALLMQDRQALVHRQGASRASGEAFDQGRDEGRREGRGDW